MRGNVRYIVAITVSIILVSMFFPAHAFLNPDGTFDNKYELYGPHADQLQFQFYSSDDALFTALQTGAVDMIDEPLTAAWYTALSENPNVNIVGAGGENGFYTINFNMDPYPFLPRSTGRGGPFPNCEYTETGNIPPITTNVYFRIGVSALFNRTRFNVLMGAQGVPILTPLPSRMGEYIWPGAYAYQYSRVQAEANFTAGHILQDKTTTPWTRYWDFNENSIVDPGEKEAAIIIFTWGSTQYRKAAGDQLYAELVAMNFSVPIGPYAWPPFKRGGWRTNGYNYQQVVLDKNYHIAILGWVFLDPNPDFLYDLYHVSGFWDDPENGGSNVGDLNDSILNAEAEGIKFAVDSAAARMHAWLFQERFLAIAAEIPLYSTAVYSASRKWYSGGNAETIVTPDDGENIYRRVGGVASGAKNEWLDFNVQSGLGTQNWFSCLNGYPNGSWYGNGHMTIRYGLRDLNICMHLNPFYSEYYLDVITMGTIYDTLGYRDPYDLAVWRGMLVENWTVGTWLDGTITKSKVTITLRPDVKWQDGTPMTIADVAFSLVEAGPLMISRGFCPPWWWPTGQLVRSFSIIDSYQLEVLYNVQSSLAESWTLGGITIVPMHIWKPMILSPTGPSGFARDPNMIGSGPWRLLSFTDTAEILVANERGSTVTTDLPESVPITSQGYSDYDPLRTHLTMTVLNGTQNSYGSKTRLLLGAGERRLSVKLMATVWDSIRSRLFEKFAINLTLNVYIYVDGAFLPSYPKDVTLASAGQDGTIYPDIENVSFVLSRGIHSVKLAVHIKGPAEFGSFANPWLSQWENVTIKPVVTVVTDITGSTLYDDMGLSGYPYKTDLPTPDGKVDLKDVFVASKAFGSKPGSSKWFSPADINHDYKVDLKDYFAITKTFNK